MRLICYTTAIEPPKIVPAPLERTWMDQSPEGFAYRCLPLNIANSHGWLVLNAAPFAATWNGGPRMSDMSVRGLEDGFPILAESHFGVGVLTFHIYGLFRTDPGYDLMVGGPTNLIKDGIQPLTGVVETDWAPFTFTMNWKFTRPGVEIVFERDEPFCMIYPVKRGLIETVTPEFQPLEANPDLETAYFDWANSRAGFIKDLKNPESDARVQKWQKHYFRGDNTYAESPGDHRTKLRGQPFQRFRRWKPGSPLDEIEHGQNDANTTGRRRLVDGVLTPTSETARIEPGMDIDPDALDFVWRPGFLTEAERVVLTTAARSLLPPVADDDDALGDQAISFASIQAEFPEAAKAMRDIQRRAADEIAAFYQLTAPIHADSMHIVRLVDGMYMDPHAVRANADGSPHSGYHRDFATILFLNDDYEGGEVYFPRLDLTVKPGAGAMLGFTGGWRHEFGVTEVVGTGQLTIPLFHSFQARRRDPALYEPDREPVREGESHA